MALKPDAELVELRTRIRHSATHVMADVVTMVRLCRARKLRAAEARFYSDALAAEPGLIDVHRYNAACAAALAGSGVGADRNTLDDAARAEWRKQALAWLRSDLAGWKKQVESEDAAAVKAARQMLAHSKQDPDLAGIREQTELGKLPDREHKEWLAFWAEVDATLASSNAKK